MDRLDHQSVSLTFFPNTIHCANADQHHSWPKMMYTDHGQRMSERLWAETLEELKFAGVKETLRKNP
jgi:hypothetical protein